MGDDFFVFFLKSFDIGFQLGGFDGLSEFDEGHFAVFSEEDSAEKAVGSTFGHDVGRVGVGDLGCHVVEVFFETFVV